MFTAINNIYLNKAKLVLIDQYQSLDFELNMNIILSKSIWKFILKDIYLYIPLFFK